MPNPFPRFAILSDELLQTLGLTRHAAEILDYTLSGVRSFVLTLADQQISATLAALELATKISDARMDLLHAVEEGMALAGLLDHDKVKAAWRHNLAESQARRAVNEALGGDAWAELKELRALVAQMQQWRQGLAAG